MRILHTSDWHLGQKFLFFDREREHQLALDWLHNTILEHEVDMLIIAGDIFDIGNPPNYARRLYYRFLAGLLHTSCRHVVVVGGNHDSPSMLNAPKDLLEALNMHVIGAATEELVDELVEIKDEKGELEAVIAAVPFLRDRDLRPSERSEAGQDRVNRIREGIVRHYQGLGKLAKAHQKKNIPILATGHLYATGAEASDKQDNIYIGNIENIDAGQFPKVFDYVALGHIHRPQAIGGKEHIRYSGSIIPLSFSETKDDKSVTLLDFKGSRLQKMEMLPLPVFRRLKTVTGDLDTIKEKLEALNERHQHELPVWVEVIVEAQFLKPQIDDELHELVEEWNMEILKVRSDRPYFSPDEETMTADLDDLEPEEVFLEKCRSMQFEPEEQQLMLRTFRELQEWIAETDEE